MSDETTHIADAAPTGKIELICRSKVKQRALEFSKKHREGKFTRVGGDFLAKCEEHLNAFIEDHVRNLPEGGKTI
jgi:hypothetical protein